MSDENLIQIMDPEGNVNDAAIQGMSEADIHKMYRLMVFSRLWNTKALSLQRQGRLGTLASIRGQEASNIGLGLALESGDWFCPSFREMGTQMALGVSPKDLLTYWGGDSRGGKPAEDSRVLSICITVGSHLLHAAGIAFGAKIRGEKIAAVSCSGDGSTSQGDFHEALNFAGVYKLPVVFVIQNNHWAISTPLQQQTATKTLAEKARAYAIDGVRVDGNDVFAVYLTIKERLALARDKYEPALVELVTYRVDDHTTADDASRYRTEEMVAPWRAKDPIERMKKYLIARRDWNDSKDAELITELTEEVERTVKEYEATELPSPLDMFDHLYAEMPWHLKEQREEVRANVGQAAR